MTSTGPVLAPTDARPVESTAPRTGAMVLLWALVGGALLAQITYALVTGEARDTITVAVVTLSAAAVLMHAGLSRGAVWASALLVTTAGVGLAAEIVGTATGFPFGSYFYAVDRLGMDVDGVPVVVPFAWTAGFYPIWCAVTYVLERSRVPAGRLWLQRIVLTAVGMVGWDLYLDTQMVTDGQWTWTSDAPGLPGIASIPVTNYLGWFGTALLMAVVVEIVDRRTRARRPAGPRMPDTAPLVLFVWTWLGSAFAHAALLDGAELRYSAVYGFCLMGAVGVPLLWTLTWRRAPLREPA